MSLFSWLLFCIYLAINFIYIKEKQGGNMMISTVDTLWVLIGTILVFFMQAGFTMVETGFTRSKNAGNIIMKNIMDFAIGSLLFWIIGYGIIYGGNNGFIGGIDLFSIKGLNENVGTVTGGAFFMFQTVFCATTATIVSGAVAERTKFTSYLLISAFLSAIVYPISAHWIWGGGFLSQLGFHDFAGSTAVHLVGGISAIIFAKLLGPRIGKYKNDGTSKAIPGHNLTLAALGIFILWFGWFGFNGGSTMGIESIESATVVSNIFVTTNISAISATIAALLVTWIKYKKPDISMTLNGILAGLVGITAGCDIVSPFGAAAIGLISGVTVVSAIEFVDLKLKIDDPVGAFGVHGVCGFLGTILVGIFATDGGLLYGGGMKLLLTQLFGVLVVSLWVFIMVFIFGSMLKKVREIRVTAGEEFAGLDIEEHGISCYADFVKVGKEYGTPVTINNSQIEFEIPEKLDIDVNEREFTKVLIVTKPESLYELKNALTKIGVNGMMVYNVMGHGVQRGLPKYYRGAVLETNLLPKICVEMVVSKVPVEEVIKTAKGILQSGDIGDGKIFISKIDNVIRIRTGEEGFEALQDA